MLYLIIMKVGRVIAGVALPLVTASLLAFCWQSRGPQEQVRPRRATNSNAKSVVVKPGGDLQGAIRSASLGDTIILQAGASYVGPVVLPNKGPGSGSDSDYITIRTSNLAGISQEGERIKPAQHARAMPKILSPNLQNALNAEEGAHHYKFIGIEFTLEPKAGYVYNLIDLGKDYASYPQFPHHLVFDRCYVHATGLKTSRRGFALNSAETSILNSHVSGFAGEGDETQAIAGWGGPGPFHIVNNYLEAGGEVILFGGADPAIQDLVPSDIEIRRNYLYKPAEWAGKVLIKGCFELKNARRVVVDGNLLDSPIRMTAMVITVRNQNGRAPWSTIEDLQITNNIVRHPSTGINFLGKDRDPPTQEAKRIRVANNLFVDVVSPEPSNTAYFLQMFAGDTFTVEHNTVQQAGNLINSAEVPTKNFVFRNNIVQHSLYGVVCFTPGTCPRDNPFCRCFPGAVFKGNIIVDSLGVNANDPLDRKYPPGNWFVRSFEELGLLDFAGGNWRLGPNSRFRGKGTDGKDPGVDFAELKASGVESAAQGSKF